MIAWQIASAQSTDRTDREWGFRTRAIHAGNIPDAVTGARALPIYQTSAFVFDDTADAAARFALQKYGNIYSPARQPDGRQLRGARREPRGRPRRRRHRQRPRARSSSPSPRSPAPATTSSHRANLYGGSVTQLDVTLRRFGVETTFVHGTDPADYAAAITDKTKLIFAEIDREPVRRDRRPRGPRRCRARRRHPAHHRLDDRDAVPQPPDRVGRRHRHPLGDQVPRRARHHPRRRRRRERAASTGHSEQVPAVRPAGAAPTAASTGHGNFGEYAFLTRLRAEQLRDIGPTLAPHSAFLLAQGVETLPFRMQAHVDNARIVAEWLEADPRIEFVNWAGLPVAPAPRARASKYLPKGPGSVFSFGVKGGRDAGQTFIESVNLASHLANIGDAKTLVIHPASTTHAQLTEQQLLDAGVLPGPRAHQRGHRRPRGHHLRPRPGARPQREGRT